MPQVREECEECEDVRLQVLAARGAGAQAEDPSDPHAKSGGAAWSVTVYCRADTVLLSPNADDDRGSYVSCHVPLPASAPGRVAFTHPTLRDPGTRVGSSPPRLQARAAPAPGARRRSSTHPATARDDDRVDVIAHVRSSPGGLDVFLKILVLAWC